MSLKVSSGIGNTNTSLPQPILPPIPLLPPTTSSSIPPPSQSTPLPPISTISTPNTGSTFNNPSIDIQATKCTDNNNENENESIDGFHPRLVLRLKTKRSDGNNIEPTNNLTFEKQDISKNDSYCWVCHEGGEVLCCDKCPRVFHIQCSGISTPPDDDDEWVCPVCKNISRKPKRSRPSGLRELLLLAVKRMMFPGTEIFQKSVPEDIIEHYREYIFYPMHLGMIKQKVVSNRFQSTREFLHETEWILHNCIIYNGGKHALTKIAKGIVKVCKEDMREIELCPSCYSLTVKQPFNWFCIPCNPPHRVVLAKVRGYPLWPAKLISETSDKCDVRFFGQHDRSLVQRSCIQDLNGPPPTPTTKTTHWTIAMDELSNYRQNINQMVQQMASGKTAEQFITEKIEEAPKQPSIKDLTKLPRIPKKDKTEKIGGRSVSVAPPVIPPPVSDQNGFHNDDKETRKREISVPPSFTVSNHIPCSPQIVMVNPSFSESEDSTIHGNTASFPHSHDPHSNPSSPGSDVGLRIDIAGTELDQARKGEKRIAPSSNRSMLKGNNKKSRNTVNESYYDAQYGTTMDVQMITPTAYRQSQSRPGEVLSLITHNLAERRAQELRDQIPSSGTSTPGGSQDGDMSMETAFSTIYPSDKLAIAVVDPDAKRQPKRKKDFKTSPTKKSKRLMNKTNDHDTPPPSSIYESNSSLVTGYESFESNGFITGNGQMSQSSYSIEELPPLQVGEGLLGDTMRTVNNSFTTRLDGLMGRNDDMGYQYFSEKMMSSIKTVVNEMLGMFESKGKMGAKQIKEHLHSAWPVPDSRSQLEKLRAELHQEMRQSLEMVRTSAEMERQQVVSEVRRQVEAEKERAIQETKRKKWCSYCWKEAQYNCCWNANYCNETCQQSHWPEHVTVCMQVQQQGPVSQGSVPRTPGPVESVYSTMYPSVPSSDGIEPVMSVESIPSGHSRQGSLSEQVQPTYTEEIAPTENPLSISERGPDVIATTVPEMENIPDMEYSMTTIERCPNHSALMVHASPILISQTSNQTLPSSGNSLPLQSQPISPATPPQPSDNPPSLLHIGNTFSWPYQQPIANMSHDLSQTLPLLPQVPALTPTTQPNTFFRVF